MGDALLYEAEKQTRALESIAASLEKLTNPQEEVPVERETFLYTVQVQEDPALISNGFEAQYTLWAT